MKLLVVTDFFYPHWTGISKSIVYLVQALEKEIETTVLTVLYEKGLDRQDKMGQVTVLREPYLFKFSRAKYSLTLIKAFLKQVRETDVVLVNSPCTNILFVSLLSKLFGKRLIIFHQGDLILPQGIRNWLLQKLFDLMSLISFSLADETATYTQDYILNSRLLPLFKHKSTALLLPLPYFKNNDKPKSKQSGQLQLKQKLNQLKQENYLIGFAGRFVEEKGFDVLLKAAAELIKKEKHVHFVFAGETKIDYEDYFSQNRHLVDRLQENLTLLGLLNETELAVFYRSLDLFVLPSRSECFGLVQAEAMAYKTPVIVSDTPGAREVVKKTGYGLVFNKNSTADLVKQIEQVMLKPSLFDEQYDQVLSYFDYEKAQKNLLRFVQG